MTDIADFTEKDLAEGAESLTLGPAYFAARRVCRAHLEAFEAEHMRPLIDAAAKQFTDTLWDSVRDYLWSDTESNLQGRMWRMTDQCVQALLSGEGWAINKYALGERYECDKVRAAVAKHVPEELQNARIADLEAEVERLNRDLRYYRER